MHSLILPNMEVTEVLEPANKIEIPLGFIPKGEFIYPIHFVNPLEIETAITVSIQSENKQLQVTSLQFSDNSYNCNFSFSITADAGSIDTSVTVIIEKNNLIRYYLPVSPCKLIDKEFPSHDWYEIEDLINTDIREWEEQYRQTNRTATTTNQNTATSMNKRQIESFIQTRYFRGLINLEEAQKQMDFVLYNKMLQPGETKGFKKWRRKQLRRIVLFFYRRITKSPSRKLYLAKLYRNYVNNNLIAENVHGD